MEGKSVGGVVEEEHLSGGNEDFSADPDLDEDHAKNHAPDHYDHTTTVVTGNSQNGQSLAKLIKTGADEKGVFLLRDGVDVGDRVRDKDGDVVKSQGAKVEISEIVRVPATGDLVETKITAEADGRVIFTLTIGANGDWKFELFDQIDHHPKNQADNEEGLLLLDFSGLVEFTDFDGDSVCLDDCSFLVKIIDDVPILLRGEKETVTVDEDDIATIGGNYPGEFQGTRPEDGNGDGSHTGDAGDEEGGPATVTGSLADLVKVGADEEVKFSFIKSQDAKDKLENLGLESQGKELRYAFQNGQLIGYVNNQGPGYDEQTDRLVFKLTLNSDGTYKFELFDQLDHDEGDGQNFDLEVPGDDLAFIDFGEIIKASDADGDSVLLDGRFKVYVKDDVPVAKQGESVSIKVDEDELAGTGAGDQDGVFGITDGDGTGDEATFSAADLKALILSGADEDITFSLKGSSINGEIVKTTGDATVTSQGATVKYAFVGGAIVGFVDTGASGWDASDREVFRITDNGDGTFTFDLKDKIDHPANGDEGTLAIDLTVIFGAEDFDYDKITLNNDSIFVVIENDVPAIAAPVIGLGENLIRTVTLTIPSSASALPTGKSITRFRADGSPTASFRSKSRPAAWAA